MAQPVSAWALPGWQLLQAPGCAPLADTYSFATKLAQLSQLPSSALQASGCSTQPSTEFRTGTVSPSLGQLPTDHAAATPSLSPSHGQDLNGLLAAASLFDWSAPISVGRAPGRLDVMGGIADYSGSLVLQMPIAEAVHVAAQKNPGSPVLRIVSLSDSCNSSRDSFFTAPLSDLFPDGAALPFSEAQAYFKVSSKTSWAAYIAGCLLVAVSELALVLAPEEGLSLLISSDVPEGKGVSSSAAVEVATMSTICTAYGIQVDPHRLATLCQVVENRIAGAPCGIMDQMAVTLGQEGKLLALLCQPAAVLGWLDLPESLAVWGIDSGVRHAVSGSDYGSVRVGAFMGLRIVHEQPKSTSETGHVSHLANIPPSLWSMRYAPILPEEMAGADFIAQYGSHNDAVTKVDSEKRYAIRAPASHPVHEHARVNLFANLLEHVGRTQAPGAHTPSCKGVHSSGVLLGELMMQSHASYSSVGLGCKETDCLVEAVTEVMEEATRAGTEPPLFGAKITGGGSGGTVAVLGVAGPEGEEALSRVLSKFALKTGSSSSKPTTVFRGSSPGAAAFGQCILQLLKN